MKDIPRNEHQRPDFYRQAWINLNGQWDFEIGTSELTPKNWTVNIGVF
ncbi:MAG: hypothetical protein ACP5JO_02925 [Candidatus Ratteibacteria bacterium]